MLSFLSQVWTSVVYSLWGLNYCYPSSHRSQLPLSFLPQVWTTVILSVKGLNFPLPCHSLLAPSDIFSTAVMHLSWTFPSGDCLLFTLNCLFSTKGSAFLDFLLFCFFCCCCCFLGGGGDGFYLLNKRFFVDKWFSCLDKRLSTFLIEGSQILTKGSPFLTKGSHILMKGSISLMKDSKILTKDSSTFVTLGFPFV